MNGCEACEDHLARNWYNLRGACASVGIEHGRTTDDMLRDYMARHHASHA